MTKWASDAVDRWQTRVINIVLARTAGSPASGQADQDQAACKPGSVPGPSAGGRPFLWDAPSPRASRDLPGRPARKRACTRRGGAVVPIRSCSRWGLPCRRRRRRRGALLPHPFTLARRPAEAARRAVCSLWHFPWGRPRRALPGTVFPWSPDFPPPASPRERPSGRLHRALSVGRRGGAARRDGGRAGPWSRDPAAPSTRARR